MACYYDEHDCQPLRAGETPDHMLHLARLLLDTGLGVEFDMSFGSVFANDKPPPPASKKTVENLATRQVRDATNESQCAVCLKHYDEDDVVKGLPCKHEFHDSCILPWLNKTNSCPVCRFELPTDDQDYETYKEQKARAKKRDQDVETLHNSMFG